MLPINLRLCVIGRRAAGGVSVRSWNLLAEFVHWRPMKNSKPLLSQFEKCPIIHIEGVWQWEEGNRES